MAPRKKSSNYSEEALSDALQAIRSGALSKRAASVKFGIPRSTLIDKTAGKYRPGKTKGRDPFLSDAEELSLVE